MPCNTILDRSLQMIFWLLLKVHSCSIMTILDLLICWAHFHWAGSDIPVDGQHWGLVSWAGHADGLCLAAKARAEEDKALPMYLWALRGSGFGSEKRLVVGVFLACQIMSKYGCHWFRGAKDGNKHLRCGGGGQKMSNECRYCKCIYARTHTHRWYEKKCKYMCAYFVGRKVTPLRGSGTLDDSRGFRCPHCPLTRRWKTGWCFHHLFPKPVGNDYLSWPIFLGRVQTTNHKRKITLLQSRKTSSQSLVVIFQLSMLIWCERGNQISCSFFWRMFLGADRKSKVVLVAFSHLPTLWGHRSAWDAFSTWASPQKWQLLAGKKKCFFGQLPTKTLQEIVFCTVISPYGVPIPSATPSRPLNSGGRREEFSLLSCRLCGKSCGDHSSGLLDWGDSSDWRLVWEGAPWKIFFWRLKGLP